MKSLAMVRFRDKAHLAVYLGSLDEDYACYAPNLWTHGIKRTEMLANAPTNVLAEILAHPQAPSLMHLIHASDLIQRFRDAKSETQANWKPLVFLGHGGNIKKYEVSCLHTLLEKWKGIPAFLCEHSLQLGDKNEEVMKPAVKEAPVCESWYKQIVLHSYSQSLSCVQPTLMIKISLIHSHSPFLSQLLQSWIVVIS